MARSCAVLLGVVAMLAFAATAQAKVVWLCKPGMTKNPCETSLETTLVSPAGEILGVRTDTPVKHPKIDCFYVYPTVSEQLTPNATLRVDPEERAIARDQASRFSQFCRVFAPMYRQQTLAGLAEEAEISPQHAALAYKGVIDGFKRYLFRFNHGRGFVFISHSQGSEMLRKLITEEVDPLPVVRRHMLSALLLGGNVAVRKGKAVGGDFQHIPACTSPGQLHCVVAFSAFGGTVPDDAVYGRVGGPFNPGDPAKLDVLCTNPAALGGGSAPLRSIFPGGLGVADLLGVPHPAVTTPWMELDGAYEGACSAADDAHVLQITPVGGASQLEPIPDATWGLHLADSNIALGDLLTLVKGQIAAYG